MAVSFDADALIAKMRASQAETLSEVRANVTDPDLIAFFEAQVAFAPAMECWVRLHIGLREAGRDESFIAALAGLLSGKIIDELLINSADPDAAFKVANRHAAQVVNGKASFGGGVLRINGTPAGRA